MRRFAGRVCLFLIAVASFSQAPTGDIGGTVLDDSGAGIPGAKITVTNRETGFARSLVAGHDGTYSVAQLPAGAYEMRAEAAGFRLLLRQATVQTGAETRVDLPMQIGTTTETVVVESAASHISYENHRIDGVVTRRQIESLPLNGRSFLQLAFLEPGVSVSSAGVGQYNNQFDVSILGGGSGRTRLTVDGSSIVNGIEGGTQQNFSQEVVGEFQISTVNFDLSTGITGTGAVNIVTRGGTNDLHGSGYFFFRDHNMAAYPALRRDPRNPDPFFARRQSGFYLGGPIQRDRLFFFFNLEHNNQDSVFTVQPNSPAFAQFARIAPSPYNGRQLSLRFDYRMNAKHNAFLRYSHDGNNNFGPRGAATMPSNWLKNTNWADQAITGITSVLRPTMVNEFRFSFAYWQNRNFLATADDCGSSCIGLGLPQIDVTGAGFIIGNSFNAPQGRDLRRYSWSDNMTWQRGSHRWRFGGEFEHNSGPGYWAFAEPAAMVVYSPEIVQFYNSQVPAAARLSIPSSFNTVEDVLRLPLAGFSTGIGDPAQPPLFQIDRAKRNRRTHVYWQDTWRMNKSLTLNYGVAYSIESNVGNHDLDAPAYLKPILGSYLGPTRHDRNNISPSLGFAWSVGNDNKTVIRAGGGIYYDTQFIWERLQERSLIGPRGNGRIPINGSLVPNPIPGIPGVALGTSLSFTSVPTAFTGAHLVSILPQVRAGLQRQIGDPNNTDLTVRNIEVFKQGTNLLTRDLTIPYTEHVNIGVQRELTRDVVVQADFVFRQAMHEQMGEIDYNHWDAVRGPAIPICRGAQALDPAAQCSSGPITVRTTAGRSHYKGLLLKLDKRFSHRTQLLVSYALADRAGFNGIVNKDNWFASYGPQGGRHSLNVSGVVDMPWGFQASFISSISTKGPFQPNIPSLDLDGDGTGSEPLPGAQFNAFNRGLGKDDLAGLVTAFNQQYAGKTTPRNQRIPTLTLPSNYELGDNFYSQDLRVTKTFAIHERYKLATFGEVFNLFNIANLGGYSNNLTNPGAFGQPNSRASQLFGSGGPRAFQLGARFSF